MLPYVLNNPFNLQFSFHKIIERLENTAATDTGWRCVNAKALLEKIALHPELRDGITSIQQIEDNAELINELLADLFPEALTLNEIKAVSLPYQGFVFNKSKRFENILRDAGESFEINIRDFDEHQFYVLSCCMILYIFYGTHLDFRKPLFYDIPTADGVIKHYRILYNADFLEILPAGELPVLTQDDINELMDNYDNLALWKKKFPVNSWVMKGFVLMSLVDVTVENALSTLKSNLISSTAPIQIKENLESIFRSMFEIPDLQMGFTLFDANEGVFGNNTVGLQLKSFLVPNDGEDTDDCQKVLTGTPYKCVIQEHTYFAFSDIDEFIRQNPDNKIGLHLKKQGVGSIILAPVIKNGTLLGILELVSPRKRELNSVTANKLEIVMPFLIDTIDRKRNEMQNKVQAVIQNYYTTLHPSVYWKFRQEAQNFIHSTNSGLEYTLKQIKFNEVYPLYGQVDISESSATRNASVQADLTNEVNQVITILSELPGNALTIEEILFDLRTFVDELALTIRADTEQSIQHYLETRVNPILQSALPDAKIESYFKHTDALTGDYHANRRNYDKTLSLINQKLATILDNRQEEIQRFFPHYYERFKTDGVEHNMYIGASIAPKQEFSPEHLHRLRLWQLRVIAEMEIEQFDLKGVLPYPLGVTSLILVFSTPIAIRFRMDEKHFDVDGAYNIRYEVIKKRIDKAHIKGTTERITQQGKITIIYSKAEEEAEYTHYINILQLAGILDNNIEHFDVEDLQAVSGLKALRVGIIHQQNLLAQRSSSYNELYKQLD
jgi:predicted metalloenzyme YecM